MSDEEKTPEDPEESPFRALVDEWLLSGQHDVLEPLGPGAAAMFVEWLVSDRGYSLDEPATLVEALCCLLSADDEEDPKVTAALTFLQDEEIDLG